MIQITDLKVTGISPDGPLVEWSILPTPEDLSLYRITVERSESPEDEFITVSPELINTFFFIDTNLPSENDWRRPYYRVRVRNAATNEEAVYGSIVQTGVDESSAEVFRDFGPVQIQGDPDFYAMEIIRRNNLLLKRFTGVPAAIFVERTFGQHCTECFDFIKQRKIKNNCLTCLGTTWVGGFYAQINTYINFHPRPVATQMGPLQEEQQDSNSCMLSNFPRVKPRDIIVNMTTGERFRVAATQQTSKRGHLVHQICNLESINHNDIEQKVDISPFVPPQDAFVGFGPLGSGLL
jgi:hypothetical protein